LFIGYSGAIMPGSLLTYTIDKSIKNGAKSGLLISLGHVLLEFALVVLLLFGVGRYLASDYARMIIGLIGGIILIIYGFIMFYDIYRKKVNINFSSRTENSHQNLMAGGVLISIINPYFTFWWATIGLNLIIIADSTHGIPAVAVFYVGHILADVSWYTFVSALISKTTHFFNMKIYRTIIVILGLCIILFGIRFIFESIKFFY
jgi:threonine/homoserine/homoserine lactone efflux protein